MWVFGGFRVIDENVCARACYIFLGASVLYRAAMFRV